VIAPSTYTFTAADAGVHTFAASFKKTGTHHLRAADTNNATLAGLEGGIVVS
jgi:hypothetical protein